MPELKEGIIEMTVSHAKRAKMSPEEITRICAEKGRNLCKDCCHQDRCDAVRLPVEERIICNLGSFSPTTSEDDLRLVWLALTKEEQKDVVKKMAVKWPLFKMGVASVIIAFTNAPLETRARAVAEVLEGRG